MFFRKVLSVVRNTVKAVAFPFGIAQNVASTLSSATCSGLVKGVETFAKEQDQKMDTVIETPVGDMSCKQAVGYISTVKKVIETVETVFDTYTVFSKASVICGFAARFVPFAIPVFPPYFAMIGLGVGIALGVAHFLS